MQILHGTTELAGTGTTGTQGLKLNGDDVYEEKPYIRADEPGQVDRMNGKTELTFRVTRIFGSVADCEMWLLDHRAAVRGIKTVKLINALGVRYLRNGSVLRLTTGPVGVSVDIDYTVKGGIVRSKP